MKGKYRIVIQNKRIHYAFEIKRNLTIIKGESATGKTALVDMVREYSENGDASGVTIQCDRECVVLEGRNWEMNLQTLHECIVFIDEGNPFVSSVEFAAAIQKTDNYYVIITREGLSSLPYSVEEIYGIRNSGKYGSLKQTYNEMYHIYGKQNFRDVVKPEVVLTEDSNAGYQFFSAVCKDSGVLCDSSNGKSNIYAWLEKNKSKETLVIADGAAIGSEMEKIMRLLEVRKNIILYLPESFEWMILKANIFNDREIVCILEKPEEYVESQKYFSWERFFTELLITESKDSYLRYSKKTLNSAYMNSGVADKILKIMECIDIRTKNH